MHSDRATDGTVEHANIRVNASPQSSYPYPKSASHPAMKGMGMSSWKSCEFNRPMASLNDC
jgi:hypothetical protein